VYWRSELEMHYTVSRKPVSQSFKRPIEDELALVDYRDPIAYLLDVVEVMRGKDDRCAPILYKFADKDANAISDGEVETDRRLVEVDD
jgi:hypothetical protein